ncbi:MAG TPA: aminotransferase class IV [Flavisolibacter sp.]|nr:aminotransferase class IV [Flavisolibacter sp.]
MMHVCFNGQMLPGNIPVLYADNRGFKYGDGVFETIKVSNEKMPLIDFHYERLATSLHILKILPSYTKEQLVEWIMELCHLNHCQESARVRLAVYRNATGQGDIIIEAQPIQQTAAQSQLQSVSLTIYPYARKSMDVFASLKTANFLPYVMAGLYAAGENFDDCLVLNSDNKICDSSKANIFIVRNNEIYTPALHQGCVNGVMRRYLIDALKDMNYIVHQLEVVEEDLWSADELFLSNSIQGIMSVKTFKGKQYNNPVTSGIYERLVIPLFS